MLSGIAGNHAAEPDTACEQKQSATRNQCHVESGECQEPIRIGLRRLGRDAGRSSARVATSCSACHLPLRAATRSGVGIRSLCERGRSQSENGNNGCKDADSSN